MTDPVVATPQDPAPSVDPPEPTPDPQVDPPEPVEPQYLTVDAAEQMLKKQMDGFQSWLGRRDKETLNYLSTVVDEKIKTVKPQITNDEYSTQLLENPRETIRSEFAAYQAEMTQKQTKHLNGTMETVANLMDSDPLYVDKELGSEVVEEVKKMVQTGKINQKLSPDDAGKLVLADAISNVFRKRQSAKVNPLAKNTPGNGSAGLTPPAGKKVAVKVPKLDDLTQRMADKWGYKPEDLAKVYGE